MSASNFWNIFKRRYLQASGSSISVTLHSLYLGARNSVTGQFQKAYSNSTIDMIISNKQTIVDPTQTGQFERVTATGMTDTQVFKGDCVTDGDGDEWTISEAWQIGLNTTTVMYMCKLELAVSRADVNYPIPDTELHTGGIVMEFAAAEFDALWILCTLTDMVQTAYDNQPQPTLSITLTDRLSTPQNNEAQSATITVTDRQSTPQNNESLTCSISTTLNTTVV